MYFCTTATKESAKLYTEVVRAVKVAEVLGYVPTAIEELNCWKNGRETEVTLSEPCAFHTVRAS